MTRQKNEYSRYVSAHQVMLLVFAFMVVLWGKPYFAASISLIAIMGYPAKLLHERRLSGKGLIFYLGVILLWVLLAPYWFRELELMP